MAAFAKLLELLARTGTRLSEVVADLPRSHVIHDTVSTPWADKGAVMRGLVEGATTELELIDGVKALHDDGWVLALPDPEEPVTHIWAEASSNAAARALAEDCARTIRTLIR
jgi:mannose-1-phosphate guanylyltransferase/phosphomannomutase